MKNIILTILIAVITTVAAPCFGSEPSFLERVNKEWKVKNYPQLLQLANAELAVTLGKPEALVVLFGYKLFVAGNHEQALQTLNQLIAALQTGKPAAAQTVQEYRDAFLQVPADGMSAPTAAQMDQLHTMFPDGFPVKALLLAMNSAN